MKTKIDRIGQQQFRKTGSDGVRTRRWRIKENGEFTPQSLWYAAHRAKRLSQRLMGGSK